MGCRETDNTGHGTHVACIVGNGPFGLAKEAKIADVKVLKGRGASRVANPGCKRVCLDPDHRTSWN